MKFNTLIMAFSLILSLTTHADDDFSKIEFKSKELTKSIFMLEGAGGNITALIGPEGVLLVDDDFAEMSEKLVTKLKELGGSSPRFIINTHFHYDHTGGNENFGTTATIIAASEVRTRLMSEQTLWRAQHPAVSAKALPVLTYDQSLELHLNNEDIKIVHFSKGHTDGDTVVFFNKNKIVSMGDLYFSGMYPIFHPEHQGSLSGYIQNIKAVLAMTPADAQIVSGHGPSSTRADLETYREMLEDSVAIVKNGIKKGLTLEQLKKIGLPKKWDSFGHGYLTTEQWIGLVYKNTKKDARS